MRALFLGLCLVIMVLPARSSAEFVWVDANGRVITPVVGEPYWALFTNYVDDAGYFWILEPEGATVRPFAGIFYRHFAEPGCTGPFYAAPPGPPRRVFEIVGLPSALFARRDDAVIQSIHVVSIETLAGCEPEDSTIAAIQESGLIALDCTAPILDACPPLHLERR